MLQAVEADPSDPVVWTQLGEFSMTDGDYNKAHACFRTALKHTESFLAGVRLVCLNSALIAPE